MGEVIHAPLFSSLDVKFTVFLPVQSSNFKQFTQATPS